MAIADVVTRKKEIRKRKAVVNMLGLNSTEVLPVATAAKVVETVEARSRSMSTTATGRMDESTVCS